MAEDIEKEVPEGEEPKKKSKKGLLIGLVLALVLGGGGFFAAYSGLIGGAEAPTDETMEEEETAVDLPTVSFVELDPLVVSLPPGAQNSHLRFRGTLEVVPKYVEDVTKMVPRVVDVLNSYLRAVDASTLAEPTKLIELRAQMLRRIQLVTGEGRVRDLLIIEFVLN